MYRRGRKKGGEHFGGEGWGKRIDQTITLLLSSYLDVGNKHRIIRHKNVNITKTGYTFQNQAFFYNKSESVRPSAYDE